MENNLNKFKLMEKKFKLYKNIKTDFSLVIDFINCKNNEFLNIHYQKLEIELMNFVTNQIDFKKILLFSLKDVPGSFFY